jgi:hypothetical protein
VNEDLNSVRVYAVAGGRTLVPLTSLPPGESRFALDAAPASITVFVPFTGPTGAPDVHSMTFVELWALTRLCGDELARRLAQ